MAKFTPSLNAKGIFTLSDPFPNISDKVYQCVAIRSFKDYVDLGQSPFEMVYEPNELDQSVYQNDLLAGANIITLVSEFEPTILVPDTYITKYPDLEYVAYSNLVVSAALGALPDGLSLELLQEQVAGVISDVIGVTPVVRVHASGSSGVVSMSQHVINEAARNAAITNRSTDRAKYVAAVNKIAELEQHIRDLEEAIIATSP